MQQKIIIDAQIRRLESGLQAIDEMPEGMGGVVAKSKLVDALGRGALGEVMRSNTAQQSSTNLVDLPTKPSTQLPPDSSRALSGKVAEVEKNNQSKVRGENSGVAKKPQNNGGGFRYD